MWQVLHCGFCYMKANKVEVIILGRLYKDLDGSRSILWMRRYKKRPTLWYVLHCGCWDMKTTSKVELYCCDIQIWKVVGFIVRRPTWNDLDYKIVWTNRGWYMFVRLYRDYSEWWKTEVLAAQDTRTLQTCNIKSVKIEIMQCWKLKCFDQLFLLFRNIK